MKNPIQGSFVVRVVIVALGFMVAGSVSAQTFTNLHSFTALAPDGSNGDGSSPQAGLIVSGNTLYATAYLGGGFGNGAVFIGKTDGSGFTNLYSFTAGSGSLKTNSDGIAPYSDLILSGKTLYGTTRNGGAGQGTVFRVNTDGTAFTNLHSFTLLNTNSSGVSTNGDGAHPINDLFLSGNTIYGTAYQGGLAGNGTVFAVNTDGTGFTNLHNFTATGGPLSTNSDGTLPVGGLVLASDTLYGTATGGGNGGVGTLFALNTNGTSFIVHHHFSAPSGPFKTNSDGAYPHDGLVLSGITLFGTTVEGGLYADPATGYGNGTIFSVNTDGSGFTNLHSFATANISSSGAFTNEDGANPNAGLIIAGKVLYGTADLGGSGGVGTVFSINTDGTGFEKLYDFTTTSLALKFTNSDGAYPAGVLALSGHTLYGTTTSGGTSANGTVFSITLPQPQLTIIPSGTSVILTWPTNFTAFSLQSTTNTGSSWTWTSNSTPAAAVNGINIVTNPISGPAQFFRLSQ